MSCVVITHVWWFNLGLIIFKCNQDCEVFKQRSHYHCPMCDKAVIGRGDFLFHLKGHDAKKGVKTPRGRKKTLATVMSDQAGVQHIQVCLCVNENALLLASSDQNALAKKLRSQNFSNHLRKKTTKCTIWQGKRLLIVSGVYDSQLFSHASLVVSPTILSLIEDQQKFWSDLEIKSGMTCLRDEGQQFCVLQGELCSRLVFLTGFLIFVWKAVLVDC